MDLRNYNGLYDCKALTTRTMRYLFWRHQHTKVATSHCTGTKNYGNYVRPQDAEGNWRSHNPIILCKIIRISSHYKGYIWIDCVIENHFCSIQKIEKNSLLTTLFGKTGKLPVELSFARYNLVDGKSTILCINVLYAKSKIFPCVYK